MSFTHAVGWSLVTISIVGAVLAVLHIQPKVQ